MMSSYSLFENFTHDKYFNNNQYGVIRLHPDNTSVHGKFKANDLVVIKYQDKQTLGILQFVKGISDFNSNSIYLTRQQRRDLALLGMDESIIHLEIKRGNLLHAIIYFFESLSH